MRIHRGKFCRLLSFAFSLWLWGVTSWLGAAELDRVVIDDNFPGAYQVEVADVNGDGRPDVVALGGGTCAWYQNPSWKKRIVTTPKQTPGIISSATADLDGDGKAEIMIAYEFALDNATQGKLVLASQGTSPDAPWSLRPITDVGSIHRLRFGDVDGDRRPDLIVAPIVGPSAKGPGYDQSPARLVAFRAPERPKEGSWVEETIGECPLLHGIKVLDFEGDSRPEVLAADNLGVTLFRREPGERGSWSSRVLVAGAPGTAPKRGASEIQVGRLADGTRFLATVEPWHGTQVAIYRADRPFPGSGPESFGPRTVIDDTLQDGHALWVADVDGDGDDEVFAGFRGTGTSVLAYDFDGHAWSRTVLDPATAAQDLRGGDLNGDGTPDFVAIGGKSHNVVWYKNRAKR
jgi:FG-GAP-like repeat